MKPVKGTDMARGSGVDGMATEGLSAEMGFGEKCRDGSGKVWEHGVQKGLRLEHAWCMSLGENQIN